MVAAPLLPKSLSMTDLESALSFLKLGKFNISGDKTTITYKEYEATLYPIGKWWVIKCAKGWSVHRTIFEAVETLNSDMLELNDIETGESFCKQVSEWSQ